METVISKRHVVGVGSLGLLLSVGIMLNILACALYDNNWWSFFVVLAYVAGWSSAPQKEIFLHNVLALLYLLQVEGFPLRTLLFTVDFVSYSADT